MKTIAVLLLLVLSAHTGLGFINPTTPVRSTASRPFFVAPSSETSLETTDGEQVAITNVPIRHFLSTSSMAGFITGAIGVIGQAVAVADDDYELAELPPAWVPAIFGVVLLAGVGLLTSSLGNVMDEGE